MIALILTIYIVVLFVAMIEDRIKGQKIYLYVGVAVLLIAMAGLREVGIDNDSVNYEYSYRHWDQEGILKEVTFSLLSWLGGFITEDVHFLFIIYAVLGVTLKFVGFRRLMPEAWFMPVLVYVSYYFVLHEMTQIRGGVAAGFFLLAIPHVCDGRKKKAAFYMFLALLFHYSAISLFPLLVFGNKDLSRRMRLIMAALIPLAYLAFFCGIAITSMPLLGDKMAAYQKLSDKGIMVAANVFNVQFLLRIVVFYFLLYMYPTIRHFNKFLPLMLRYMLVSMLLFLYLSPFSVLAFRIMELYGIVDIILYASIFYCFKQSNIGRVAVAILCSSQLFLNLFYLNLLQE